MGADLNNATVRARTIVNQVTSTDPSLIQGNIAVLGPRANVIIANPNGITVDGGSFTNTGNVALTTGQVSFNDFTTGAGQLQRNVVLNTGAGAINIGPGGLAGAMLNLELIAKQVRVAGAVQNSFTDANSKVRIVAGDSRAEIDTSVSPTDNLNPWVTYSTTGSGRPLGWLSISRRAGRSRAGGSSCWSRTRVRVCGTPARRLRRPAISSSAARVTCSWAAAASARPMMC